MPLLELDNIQLMLSVIELRKIENKLKKSWLTQIKIVESVEWPIENL